ncbi:hypothetical protein AGDE_01013 [Angomonas deanei]|uniref:Ca2+ insensitive EF hand/EF hand/EF-hand domain pair/EF-hand domain containing protein, putative n=1 Tax=Angomonas deanei TaxID=59799 RepID=A0A7G2CD97_9TRYP|nr:hypothetical protein AGDE_01013 [Angomonas deanei]CAD2217800.1 Ca2+ insensitive EF hand/EF hand/EF-hand domain pair/EF-hand domain containing protein, putative [Angomonas deanei]|eukprot:EPY42910.1 hypothetical protein AGDE_01013 [Angomonas deanei]
MGLNLSQSDLVYVVQLVEYDAPSSGAVSKSRLESVLVDAMMTNVLGGDTLKATGIIPLDRFGSPISVQRNTLDEVYRAFKAIDKDNKGYLEPEELKAAMTSEGERFTEDEMEEMLQALVDPETGRLIYEDIAGILSSE